MRVVLLESPTARAGTARRARCYDVSYIESRMQLRHSVRVGPAVGRIESRCNYRTNPPGRVVLTKEAIVNRLMIFNTPLPGKHAGTS
jgi:hypothetical protein